MPHKGYHKQHTAGAFGAKVNADYRFHISHKARNTMDTFDIPPAFNATFKTKLCDNFLSLLLLKFVIIEKQSCFQTKKKTPQMLD